MSTFLSYPSLPQNSCLQWQIKALQIASKPRISVYLRQPFDRQPPKNSSFSYTSLLSPRKCIIQDLSLKNLKICYFMPLKTMKINCGNGEPRTAHVPFQHKTKPKIGYVLMVQRKCQLAGWGGKILKKGLGAVCKMVYRL